MTPTTQTRAWARARPDRALIVQRKWARLVGPLRLRARQLGYALTVHGSLARDIDLVAIPWVDDCVTQGQLADALIAEVEAVNGVALVWRDNTAHPNDFTKRNAQAKPHGRLGWTIHLGGGPFIDLAVMPPISPIRSDRV